MGLVPVEKSFPRGGQAAAPRNQSKERRRPVKTRNLFGGKKAPSKPQKEVLKNKDGTKKKVEPYLRLRQYNGRLTHKTVSEGMLLLGSISRIEKFQLTVILPGNIKGTVPVTNISEPYSTALRSVEDSEPYQLRDMFSVGQHVVTRVVSKVSEINSTQFKITLSMMPECVYSDLSHSDVVTGSVLTAAVKSIEEKGYIMDLGIKNTTAFLKRCNAVDFENDWNKGRSLGIGQLVRCLVKKATAAESSTIVILSAKPELVAGATSNNTGATLETLVPGMQFNATVSVLFNEGIQVRLSDNFVGYVQQDHFSKPFKTPDNFELGTMVTAKVLYILDNGAVHFTLKSGIFESQPRRLPLDVVRIGDVVEKAVVISINNGGYTVRVGQTETDSLKGFIPLSQTTFKRNAEDEEFDVPMSQQLAKEHPIGSEIKCRVTDYNYMDEIYLCTMNKSLMTEKYIHASMLKPGLVLQCFIKRIQPKGIAVLLGKSSRMTAFVPLIHSSDVPLTHPEKKFNIGQPVTAKVLTLKDGNTLFTLKPTLVHSTEPMLTSYEEAEKDVRYEGTVVSITGEGLLVEFYNSMTGWVPSLSLHKIAAANIDKNFYVGQVVQCTVIMKIDETQKLILNMKDGPLPNEKKKEKKMQKQLDVLVEREKEKTPSKSKSKEKGKVESSEEINVKPKKRKIKEKVTSTKKAEEVVASVFDVRKTVDLSLRAIRRERKKFLESLHLEAAQASEAAAGSTEETPETNNLELNGTEPKAGRSKSGLKRTSDTMGLVDARSKSDSAADRPGKKATGVKAKAVPVGTEALPRLSVSTGFVWDPTPDLLPALARAKIESESSDEEVEPVGKKAKKTRQAIISEKRALAQAEEARLRAVEQRLMDTEQPPQSADEFDRLVLSSPDSSMVWLQYMAHHLQATEIEKARGVAQRALKAICFREEQERLNVWVALLNLENLYGTKESLELTLEEAVKVNDAYQVYTQMLQIYGDSQKLQEGDKLIVLMTKKYKGRRDMWFDAATFYMRSGQMEKARALLQRALASLAKKEHVAVISRFAQLENRLGSTERAQTLMEQILSSYPRRVDVWSAYVDMLVKSGLHHLARQVLERAVVQKLPSQKMKTLFTKFLSFEEAHGTEDGANKVRQMALEYVESAAGAAIQ